MSLLCPCYPYLFTTMTALLVARKLEDSTRHSSQIGWGVLLAALIVASLLLASAAKASLGAIVASICVAFFWNRRLGFARLKSYFWILLVGVAVQGFNYIFRY
jgi:uncharacterized membrane protein